MNFLSVSNESFRLKKSLETAAKLGANFAIIVDENETASGNLALKDLRSGQQVSVPRAQLAKRILRLK